MKLSELGLNRFMYKEVQDIKTSDSSDVSYNTQESISQVSSARPSIPYESAKEVLPGTVIKSCIIISNSMTTQDLIIIDIGGNPIGRFTTYGTGNSIALIIGEDFGYEFHPSYFTFSFNESEPMPAVDLGTITRPFYSVYAEYIGDVSAKTTLFGNVIACPLPTIQNALDLIRKIPAPTKVGDRGHFGDRLYFDDITFPEEGLFEVKGKKEIEHTMMIGILMKAVVELTAKVDELEKRLP